MTIPQYYWRLRELQHRCWNHGHKKWAADLGRELRELRDAHPDLWGTAFD
jgi:hypothetical protein